MSLNLPKRQRLREALFFASSLFWHTFSFGALNSFYVPGFLINHNLLKQFPVSKKWLIFEITFTNPQLEFKKVGQELLLNCDFIFQAISDQSIQGNMKLASSYTYDPKTSQLFIQNARIETFNFEGLHPKAEQLIEQMSPLIGSFFNGKQVYQLSQSDLKTLKKPPSSIVVEDDGIRFYFN
jgi:hypothetical protein